jgi:hypothetical protein
MAFKCLLNTRSPLEVWPGTRLHLTRTLVDEDTGKRAVDLTYRHDGDEEPTGLRVEIGGRFELDGRVLRVVAITPGGLYPVELHEIR